MRQLGGVFLLVLIVLVPAHQALGDNSIDRNLLTALGVQQLPPAIPATDETPIEGDGNSETDALLDCYAKLQGPTLDGEELGPPHLAHNPSFGYVLRADFLKRNRPTGVDRLICWKRGFATQNGLPVAPLDPFQSETLDAGSKRSVFGWQARKQAMAESIATARRFSKPDSDTIRLLEGIWLIGEQPDKGPCTANSYKEVEIEFDFKKTGGRALILEPDWLFTPIAISGIEKSNDVLLLQAEARNGGLSALMKIRPQSTNRLEILPRDGAGPDAKSQIAYRCGDADPSVTALVSLERLSAISPSLTGGWAFPAVIPGVSDADVCQDRGEAGKNLFTRKWIQFDLLGPVHYYVLGWQFWPEHKMTYDFVRSVHSLGDHTLVLQMQEHVENRGDGWDVEGSRGKVYQLTVIDHGDRIEVPELSASFVRCKATDPASIGLVRQ